MNVCQTCLHWEEVFEHKHEQVPADLRIGECTSSFFVKGYGPVTIQHNQVMVENDEGWGFMTGPAFGCVHWQGKHA